MKFLVNKKPVNRQDKYEYHPNNKYELQVIIFNLIEKGISDLNCIDVSKIDDMSWLFHSLNFSDTELKCLRQLDISKWDVSNVTDMHAMFCGCPEFNADLSKWDVSNVKNMSSMFEGCANFTCDLSNWKVSKDTKLKWIFYLCKNLKIPKWYDEFLSEKKAGKPSV